MPADRLIQRPAIADGLANLLGVKGEQGLDVSSVINPVVVVGAVPSSPYLALPRRGLARTLNIAVAATFGHIGILNGVNLNTFTRIKRLHFWGQAAGSTNLRFGLMSLAAWAALAPSGSAFFIKNPLSQESGAFDQIATRWQTANPGAVQPLDLGRVKMAATQSLDLDNLDLDLDPRAGQVFVIADETVNETLNVTAWVEEWPLPG